MSEVSLPALVETCKEEESLEPIKQINAALKACTFGRFHIMLLSTAFFAHVAACLVSVSTGYLLPVAECDLNMSLLQKGLLNAMPYVGMLMSTVVGGFFSDAFGRKFFLVVGFGGVFLFTVIEASSQTYEVIITAKFFEGLLFAICFNPLITLTSEFCPNEIRDRMVLLQSSFISIAQIVIAFMSWGFLINDWKISLFGGSFGSDGTAKSNVMAFAITSTNVLNPNIHGSIKPVMCHFNPKSHKLLNTWNFYLYAVSLWSLASCVMYGLFVPESPKYLVTQKKYDEARDILTKIYVRNTGNPAATYPFKDIWKDTTKDFMKKTLDNEIKTSFQHRIVVGFLNSKPMFKKPLVVYLILICTINFIVMCMYNVFRLWFPQLSAIVENYETEDEQDLCVMLDSYTSDLKAMQNSTQPDICVPIKSGTKTYINSVIIGFVCLVPYLVSGILVNKVGKKRLLIAGGLISVAACMSLRWANTITAIVVLFSMTIAISQVMMALSQALTIEVFGTTTRTLAVSLMMMSGRVGTLTGNISFPVLLEMGCEIPFFTIAALMFCVIILSVFMPSKK